MIQSADRGLYHVYRDDFDSVFAVERNLPVMPLRREAGVPARHATFSWRYIAGVLGALIGGASILIGATLIS